MIKIIFKIFVILTALHTNVVALELNFTNTFDKLGNEYVVVDKQGFLLSYGFMNAIDGQKETCVALNQKYYENKPFFGIPFNHNIKIDKIIVRNGHQKNANLYLRNSRVKAMQLLVYERNYSNNYSMTLNTNIELLDVMDNQVINLSNVNGWYWGFGFISNYPGLKYEDICLSEVEFWYKGQKYDVANLEQARKEYVAIYKQELLKYFPQIRVLFQTQPDRIMNMVKATGWKLNEINTNRLGLQFMTNGQIKLVDLQELPKLQKFAGHVFPSRVMGQWKLDTEGRFFVRVGKGPWKLNREYFLGDLKGTDLESRVEFFDD